MNKRQIPVILTLALVSGCATNKNLVFFTNTSIGVEVAVEPSGPSPGKFVLGFKRQEGVLDPVHAESSKDAGKKTDKIRDEAHSVLAKLNFGTKAEKLASAENAQWFATGEAARIIAKAPAIAGAVTGSAEIAKAATKAALFTPGEDHISDITEIRRIVKRVNDAAAGGKAEAKKIVEGLDDAAKAFAGPGFELYEPDSSNIALKKTTQAAATINTFDDLLNYWQKLNRTRTTLRDALQPAILPSVTLKDSAGIQQALQQTDIDSMKDTAEFATKRLEILAQSFSSHPNVLAALDYYGKSLFASNNSK